MRTTLDLPDPIFRQLKAESALRGLKLKDFVTELIQSGLQSTPRPAEMRARSPLPVIRKATGATHPALDNRQIEDLLIEEDSHGQA